MFKPSLFNTEPLKGFLTKFLSTNIKRRATIGSVNSDNGTLIRFNLD